jgi:hypothetical protein
MNRPAVSSTPGSRNEVVSVYGLDRLKALGEQSTEGFEGSFSESQQKVHANLLLMALGMPTVSLPEFGEVSEMTESLLAVNREQSRILSHQRCPVDQRIESFLKNYFSDIPGEALRLPNQSLILDRHGVARVLSLPVNEALYENRYVSSYRLKNGVLHNPLSDRRTTSGTFHVTEGGLPIAGDKRAVPKAVFHKLFQVAMKPSGELQQLPFTSKLANKAETFVSLYLRPLVSPEVPGVSPHKSMEIRFFAPGSWVSNLDFVESIFGNAGNPLLPDRDAALDVEHWSGHTGCVILAPQLLEATKKSLGLPHWEDANERQRRDRMCWQDAGELYNDGQAFKITCRDASGVIVTLIADNYFGYCKKEVKTQISFATNLYGNSEEEHAGGAIAFPSYSLGDTFKANSMRYNGRTFADVVQDYGDTMHVHPEGYGVDKLYPNLIYIHEEAFASLKDQRIRWQSGEQWHDIPILPGHVYMAPSGYKLRMEKHPNAPSWRLIGTVAEGTFCHKPCTVSGGGKSEISKSLNDYMHYGPLYIADFEKDSKFVQEIFEADYRNRWNKNYDEKPDYSKRESRAILGPKRTLGSVIKLLTPSSDYNDDYNAWLKSIPDHILSMVFIIKRFEEANWAKRWKDFFGVDIVNGHPGHELKFRDRSLVGTYLRVGFFGPQKWRTYKLRQDFAAATKIQTEDDISASTVVPGTMFDGKSAALTADVSHKFLINCEYRLFQRPDEAIHRGFDKQAEADLAKANNFISNFEPLTRDKIQSMAEHVVDFDAFSQPMKNLLTSMLEDESAKYVVCSANPRQIDGKLSKNPRYLQDRPDMVDPFQRYVADRSLRLYRALKPDQAVYTPVNAVLAGRRNNPPDAAAGIRGLAVYNPIHYQELPELFMDFICSLTGKSPSTTGFGSEGALTKGPFNALQTAADLNAAYLSYVLTGLGAFSSAAGHIGPEIQVDHDVSLLVPEVWCRLTEEERNAKHLIESGCLEKLDDFEEGGETVLASRLGYRITDRFISQYFGRIFDNPSYVFDEKILKPETQDREAYIDGIKYICHAHKTVAQTYLEDGTYEDLCPPLKVLIHVMAEGKWNGKSINDPTVRSMFTREATLSSDWYKARLKERQRVEKKLMQRHLMALDEIINDSTRSRTVERMNLTQRRVWVTKQLEEIESESYLEQLIGTTGTQPEMNK